MPHLPGYHPKDLLRLRPKIIQNLLGLLSDMAPPIVSKTFYQPQSESIGIPLQLQRNQLGPQAASFQWHHGLQSTSQHLKVSNAPSFSVEFLCK